MGFQATVTIHLDDLGNATKNHQAFAEEITQAILDCANGANTLNLGYTFGSMSKVHGEVLDVHHSDNCSLVLTGGNTGAKITEYFSYAVSSLAVQEMVLKEALNKVQSKLKTLDKEKR